jgi:3-deoxy-D-manno-octulosonic-acid transferase
VLFNFIYFSAMLIASPWIAYRAIAHGRYRRGVMQKLFGLRRAELPNAGRGQREVGVLESPFSAAASSQTESAPTAWFHAVSVGEVNLLPGLIAAFRKRHPHWQVVVSCSTDTGFELANERFAKAGIFVFFCPLDFTWAVRRTIKTLQPQLLVLAELELWPNLIRLASESGCQCAVINGRLSERSYAKYMRLNRFFRRTFARLAWVGSQDHDYAARFIACGAPESVVNVTGSLKFDNAPTSRDTIEVSDYQHWAGANAWHQVLIAGSTHDGEERISLNTYKQLIGKHPELRLVITPRHASRFDEVAKLIVSMGLVCRRRSTSTAPATEWNSDTVILVDKIGELRHWWGTARIAFVGGAFGDRGGQNMLEPAGYGCAVCFGPNTRNFEDIARRLIAADGAVRLQVPAELTSFVERCLTDHPAADRMGIDAQSMVLSHLGATDKTVDHLATLAASREIVPFYRRAA